jgi:hypothetical protein
MSTLGVFRDDLYNSISVLAGASYAVLPTEAVLAASQMVGAEYVFVQNTAGSANTALTTDTAVNIITALQNAIAVAAKASQANGGGFATGLGLPLGVPNLFNIGWQFVIYNTEGATLTITAGTGVTLVGTATITTATMRSWVITVTSPTTITMQTLGQSGVITA